MATIFGVMASANKPRKIAVDFLVVAGGGGAGSGSSFQIGTNGGGGGAGGVRSTVTTTGGGGSLETALNLDLTTNYTVTIGAGGAGGFNSGVQYGLSGSNSVFATVTSIGGGGGGDPDNTNNRNGGSGGGAGGHPLISTAASGGTGTANQGYAGGGTSGMNGSNSGAASGGGAGGAGVSRNAVNTGAVGGAAVYISITGSSVRYGLGGATDSTSNGLANRGDGGSTDVGDYNRDGNQGGSGVVILKYPDSKTITIGAGLTGSTAAPAGGYKVTSITAGTGNVSWS